MCFLYRQSISIVYESKFKYIYRYFIKIDRCFCGILQSLPLRKCGLKFQMDQCTARHRIVTSLAEVWIEISEGHWFVIIGYVTSLAEVWIEMVEIALSFTLTSVTSLAEVWIEIFLVCHRQSRETMSLPLRKCGLKFCRT